MSDRQVVTLGEVVLTDLDALLVTLGAATAQLREIRASIAAFVDTAERPG